VIEDPSFENKPPNAWSVSGASLTATSPGDKDPGLVELAGPQCNPATTAVKQTVTLPPFALGEPLALEVFARARCQTLITDEPPTYVDTACSGPIVMTFGTRGSLPFEWLDTPASRRRCLGDKYFGKTSELTFGASTCGGDTLSVVLDRADIVPAPECPRPGEVKNGNFEGDGGWVVEGTGTAEVVAGIGTMGSRGGRLRKSQPCQTPRLRGTLSVPAGLAKPALTFSSRGAASRRMRVLVDEAVAGVVTGTGVFERTTLCLADYAKGESPTVVLTGAGDRRTCTGSDDYEFVFDDLAIVSEPSCPDAAPVVDGSFERADSAAYWAADLDPAQTLSFPKTGGAVTGAGLAQLGTFQCGRYGNALSAVTIPEKRPGAGGPALFFSYKATSANGQIYFGPLGTVTPAADFRAVTRCLPTRLGGSPFPVSFGMTSASSCVGGTLQLDDLRVGYDPMCAE